MSTKQKRQAEVKENPCVWIIAGSNLTIRIIGFPACSLGPRHKFAAIREDININRIAIQMFYLSKVPHTVQSETHPEAAVKIASLHF